MYGSMYDFDSVMSFDQWKAHMAKRVPDLTENNATLRHYYTEYLDRHDG